MAVAPHAARRHFSLIELTIVLLLLALMLALVAPRAGRIPRAVAVRSLIGTVESAFRHAGLRARASGRPVMLEPDPRGNCLRVASPGTSEPTAGEGNGESSARAPRSAVEAKRKYEFPSGTEWFAEGDQLAPDSELPHYVFFPGGEAGGPDITLIVRKQSFHISVDRLTGRPIVTREENEW